MVQRPAGHRRRATLLSRLRRGGSGAASAADVGTALIEGKDKDNRKVGQKFSEWVQEMFPGLHERAASAAMKWAEESETISEIPADLTHPVAILAWHREQQAAAADALWMSANSVVVTEMDTDASHPKVIRQLFNEQQATAALPARSSPSGCRRCSLG